jgi:hypothetical protein
VSNRAPALGRPIDTGSVIRHVDPIRKQRFTYGLADPYLQFHYAVLEPHRGRLGSHDPRTVWAERETEVLDSQVRGSRPSRGVPRQCGRPSTGGQDVAERLRGLALEGLGHQRRGERVAPRSEVA